MKCDGQVSLDVGSKECCRRNFSKRKPVGICGSKLYRIDIIRTFDLKYDENMKLFEDACFVFSYLNYCTSIKFINKNVYYYNQLMNISASRKKLSGI